MAVIIFCYQQEGPGLLLVTTFEECSDISGI